MTRFENRHAARIIQYLDIVARVIAEELNPNLQAIIQEQALDQTTHPPIRMDDAADKIARVFRRVTVFVEQEISDPRVRRQAERTGNEINDANQDFNEGNIKAVLGVSVFPQEPWLETEMDHFVHENASLIQGLTEEQIRDVEQSVFRNVRAGAGTARIQEDILSILNGLKGRAKLVARDQTNKFNGRLSELRQKALGVTEYTWRTAQDERVRPTHQALDADVIAWDSPPVTVRSGRRAGEQNHPGQDIQCRCIAEPIFPDQL